MMEQRTPHARGARNRSRNLAPLAISIGAAIVAIPAAPQSVSAFSSPPQTQVAKSDEHRSFAEAVAALDSDDWHTRLDAADFLRAANVMNSEIETLIDSPSMTPEQRYQLLSILKHRVLERAAGAIGIQMNTSSMRNNMIVVDRLFTNMPAEKMLIPGDRITHINGRPIEFVNEFRNELRRLVPGDVVTLEVERLRSPGERDQDGEPAAPDVLPEGWNDVPREHPPSDVEILHFEIALGAADSLGNDHMDDVWRERLEEVRVLSTRHQPQSVPLVAADWRSYVDRHRVIEELQRQLQDYNGLSLSDRRILINSWQRTYQQLFDGYREGGISNEERAYRRDILSRFRELLPAGVTQNW